MRARSIEPNAEWLSALFMGLIALIARMTGVSLFVFPELGALSHDILKRPYGAWATAPIMLVLTPLTTAAAGVLITRHVAFGVGAQILDILVSLLVIGATRSPVAPAISAGLLPLMLGIRSWWYPPSITVGTALLAALSMVQRRLFCRAPTASPQDAVDDLMEKAPTSFVWLVPLLSIITALGGLARWSGLRYLVFPPLVVIGFEMFAHTRACPWAGKGWRLPLACLASATAGVCAVAWFGAGILAAIVIMIASIAMLRLLDLHAPPVLAVGLLAMVIPHPGLGFVAAVLIGTIVLVSSFVLWQAWTLRASATT